MFKLRVFHRSAPPFEMLFSTDRVFILGSGCTINAPVRRKCILTTWFQHIALHHGVRGGGEGGLHERSWRAMAFSDRAPSAIQRERDRESDRDGVER